MRKVSIISKGSVAIYADIGTCIIPIMKIIGISYFDMEEKESETRERLR
jgi:hypothetical protein